MIRMLLSWLTGGGVAGLADQFRKTYELKLAADNNEQRMAADIELRRIEAIMHTASLANADLFSATSLGRYLIVLPFGMWWTATFIDSTFSMPWNTLALPPAIQELAWWLVPVIVAGDVGRSFIARR